MTSRLDPYTYILIDRKPVQHANDDEWFHWYLDYANRRVAKTTIGDIEISTVFTSLNIIPQDMALFETMVFGGPLSGLEEKDATWREAEATHLNITQCVKAALDAYDADEGKVASAHRK